MKSTRDSQRLSELQTITKAIGLYLGDGKSSVGTANIVYVSIPDSSATCANLGLPSLPAGWSYQCSTEPNYRKTDGTGWIPIAFNTISFGNTLDTLPIDPVNATTSLNYYTYITGGSFELTAAMESFKYKMGGSNDVSSKDNGSYPELYEMGSNLTLLPVNYGDTSLVGYWKFDEGSGTTAYDASGHGNNGTLTNGPAYTTAKVGNYALSFSSSSNNYVKMGNLFNFSSTGTFSGSAWIKLSFSSGLANVIIDDSWIQASQNAWNFYTESTNGYLKFYGGVSGSSGNAIGTKVVADNNWHYVVFTYNNKVVTFYIDGVKDVSGVANMVGNGTMSTINYGTLVGANFNTNNNNFTNYANGLIDDVRVYNRALSATEIQAIYIATNK